MRFKTITQAAALAATCLLLSGITGMAQADEASTDASVTADVSETPSFFNRANNLVQNTLGEALAMLGVPYRRGGTNPQSGFDCSGFVSHVFQQSVGLVLPHNAKAMSNTGEKVDKQSLQPGDLVFFNTMRRAFSHVGIYLGEGLFVHSPRPGGEVRVESMHESYWKKRFNGARRVSEN